MFTINFKTIDKLEYSITENKKRIIMLFPLIDNIIEACEIKINSLDINIPYKLEILKEYLKLDKYIILYKCLNLEKNNVNEMYIKLINYLIKYNYNNHPIHELSNIFVKNDNNDIYDINLNEFNELVNMSTYFLSNISDILLDIRETLIELIEIKNTNKICIADIYDNISNVLYKKSININTSGIIEPSETDIKYGVYYNIRYSIIMKNTYISIILNQ